MAFISTDQAKTQLGILPSDTVDAAKLDLFIAAAEDAVERHLDTVITQRTFTEEVTAGHYTKHVRVTHTPLVAVQSLTVDGVTQDLTGMLFRASGSIRLATHFCGWVEVDYTAGLLDSDIPANYTEAGLIIMQHLWQTTRGDMPGSYAELQDSFTGRTMAAGLGYAIPNQALELLGRADVPVF
jgi:hypothetical protein